MESEKSDIELMDKIRQGDIPLSGYYMRGMQI